MVINTASGPFHCKDPSIYRAIGDLSVLRVGNHVRVTETTRASRLARREKIDAVRAKAFVVGERVPVFRFLPESGEGWTGSKAN